MCSSGFISSEPERHTERNLSLRLHAGAQLCSLVVKINEVLPLSESNKSTHSWSAVRQDDLLERDAVMVPGGAVSVNRQRPL